MGKFANELEGNLPRWIGEAAVKQAWRGESEWAAMGREVPPFRKAAAERHLKSMGFADAEFRFSVVNVMSEAILRDNTHEALEKALEKGLDATGCYRLLSVLLCEPESASQ